MPNVLSPRDLVSRPDNMDETVLSSSCAAIFIQYRCQLGHNFPLSEYFHSKLGI